MAYKLVCLDMDGTLLNSRKQISAENKAALKQAHEQGVRIALSTGRIYVDARYYTDLIGIRAPIIAANGAYIQDENEDQPICQSLLGADLALRILNICQKYHIDPTFYTPEKEYHGSLLRIILWALLSLKSGLKRKAAVRRKYVRHWQWKKVIIKEQTQIIKCVIIGVGNKKLRALRREFAQLEELEVTSSGRNNIELNYKGTSKGKGVEILGRHYNLKREEIMAIGDSENDLSMIEYAGLGVAMGNALTIVKEKADCITDTNDHHGVAKAIRKFVLDPAV